MRERRMESKKKKTRKMVGYTREAYGEPLSNVLTANKTELQRVGEPQDSGTLCKSSVP